MPSGTVISIAAERFWKRAARARLLADRYPASREALVYFAAVSEFQAGSGDMPQPPAPLAPEYLDRILRETAPQPSCEHVPQLGVLRPQGDGKALSLACALCRHEWSFPRTKCPACGSDKITFGSAEAFPAVRTQLCETCKTYFHILDLAADPEIIPEADEIAAQPLDVWALDQGYTKIFPNLVGL